MADHYEEKDEGEATAVAGVAIKSESTLFFIFFWQRVNGAGPTLILLLFLLEEATHQAWSCHPVSMTLSCL